MPRSCKCCLSLRFPHQNLIHISLFLHTWHLFCPPHSPTFNCICYPNCYVNIYILFLWYFIIKIRQISLKRNVLCTKEAHKYTTGKTVYHQQHSGHTVQTATLYPFLTRHNQCQRSTSNHCLNITLHISLFFLFSAYVLLETFTTLYFVLRNPCLLPGIRSTL